MKIVVAGMKTTGINLVSILQSENHDLILIEKDRKAFQSAQEHFDAQIERGDVSDPTVLEPIIDETVDLFIALTADDATNIISTMIARKFGVKRAIVRINDPNNLIHPLLTDDPQVHLLNAEMILSKDLNRLIGTPSADEVEFFAKGKAEMATLHVHPGSVISGKKLIDASLPSSWLVVAVIRRGSFVIASGETEVIDDDQLLVVGNPSKYSEIEKALGLEHRKVRRVILVGYNQVSSKLAITLQRKGIEVRLIEEDKELAEKAAADLDGVLVLQGDSTDDEILDQVGCCEADYIIALTEDDETNVLISLLAKEKGVKRVVTLTQKPQYKRIIQKIGIDTVINPRSSLIDEVIRCIHIKDILGINILEGGQGRMLEFEVNEKTRVLNKPLSKVKLPKQILIGAILRGDELIIPRGSTQVKVGDHVVVFSTLSVLSEVKKIFGH